MSKPVIDSDHLTFWQAVKIRFALGDSESITVKHENTGLGWVAIAIVLASLIIKGGYL